jgi:hypothetical protein
MNPRHALTIFSGNRRRQRCAVVVNRMLTARFVTQSVEITQCDGCMRRPGHHSHDDLVRLDELFQEITVSASPPPQC